MKNCFKMLTFGNTDYGTYVSNITLQYVFGDVFLQSEKIEKLFSTIPFPLVFYSLCPSYMCSSQTGT